MDSVQLSTLDDLALDAAVHGAASEPRGAVIQLHGLTAEMDEGGMYVRLADGLAAAGFHVLRFSFRGHGGSGGTDQGMTIAGEMLDLEAALRYVDAHLTPAGAAPAALSIVASSFGAVSTSLSLPFVERRLHGLVLWNPILDLTHTFIQPELPWGQVNFRTQVDLLESNGYLVIDDIFKMGRVLYEEVRHYGRKPLDYFLTSRLPSLVIHCDKDTYVSYDIARDAVADRASGGRRTDFHTVEGSDHGFDTREREDEAIAVTIDWLKRRHKDELD